VVTSVSPQKLGVGDVMTITGKNFRKGKNKNTVVFKRDGGRAVFVKAPDATTTKIGVTVPAKLLPFLLKKTRQAHLHRFRIRVLAKRFAKKFTNAAKSPMIGPDAIGGGTKDDCDGDKIKNKVDTDDDNDLIPDTLEATLGHRPVQPRHRRRRRVRRLGVLLRARPQRQGQAGPVRPALPEPAGRQGRRHRPRRRRPDRHPGVQRVGELRRQQAAPELLGRQPGLGRPRAPARRAWPTWTATTTAS
jgi:hypothetical protein